MQYSIVNYSDALKNSDFRMDAEYFHPLYLKLDKEFLNYDTKLIGEFAYVTDGEHGSVELKKDGIKYLMGENIKSGVVNLKNIRYVDESVHIRNKRASVEAGNILISIKGSLGDIAIAEEWLLPANMSRDVAIIKIKDTSILSEYVCIYLMSNIGQTLAIREGSGGVQQMITLGRLRNIKVPVFSEIMQTRLKEMYKKSLQLRESSKSLYAEAENLLLSELGLETWKPQHKLSYVKNFSDTVEAERIDAEYFQPKYDEIVETAKKFNAKKISVICKLQRGAMISMDFYNENNGTPYIRGADFSSGNIEDAKIIYIDESFERKNEAILNEGDIVFASIGSVGTTALIEKKYSGSFFSNNTAKLSIKNKNEVNPVYLQIVLISIVGQLQFEKFQTQTAQPKISNREVGEILIPILPTDKQKEIAQKIIDSRKAREESKDLFEKAKRAVEIAIEESEGAAMEFLKDI